LGESVPVVGLIGGKSALQVQVAELEQRLVQFERSDVLQQMLLDNPYTLLSHYVLDAKGLATFSEGAAINTDNSPIIEFTSPLLHQSAMQLGSDNMQVWIGQESQFEMLLGEDMPASSLAELQRHRKIKQLLIQGLPLAAAGELD